MVAAILVFLFSAMFDPYLFQTLLEDQEKFINLFSKAFIIIAPREEGIKLLTILVIFFYRGFPEKRINAICCGSVVGLGFATMENFFYLSQIKGALSNNLPVFLLLRFIFSNLGHCLFGGLLAAYLKDSTDFKGTPLLTGMFPNLIRLFWGFVTVCFLHGLFDFITYVASDRLGYFHLFCLLSLVFVIYFNNLYTIFEEQMPETGSPT
ncbi:PrsW family glutamic-type intramembrane protease [Candidatus Riflebacteria bacterium]